MCIYYYKRVLCILRLRFLSAISVSIFSLVALFTIFYLLYCLFPSTFFTFVFCFFNFIFVMYGYVCIWSYLVFSLSFFSLLPLVYTFYLFGGKSITWLCVSVRVCTSFFSSFISFRFCLLILLLILLRCFYSLFFAFFFFSSFFLVLFFCYLILEFAIL